MKLQKSFTKALTLAVLTASVCQPVSATLGQEIEQIVSSVVANIEEVTGADTASITINTTPDIADTVPTTNTTSDVAITSKFDALKAKFSDKLDALKANALELMAVATEKTESVCGSVADFAAGNLPSGASEFALENPKTTTALVISTALVATYAVYKAFRLACAYVATKCEKDSSKNK
jgi:hypothetical protein